MSLFSWLSGLFSGGPTLRTPEEITVFILDNYDRVQEKDYQAFEHAAMLARSPQQHLIYALRISSILPTVKTVKTLTSRWCVTHCGAGGAGLNFANGVKYHDRVTALLSERYLTTLQRLLSRGHEDFVAKLSGSKSEKRKATLISKYCSDLLEIDGLFHPQLPGVSVATNCYRQLYMQS